MGVDVAVRTAAYPAAFFWLLSQCLSPHHHFQFAPTYFVTLCALPKSSILFARGSIISLSYASIAVYIDVLFHCLLLMLSIYCLKLYLSLISAIYHSFRFFYSQLRLLAYFVSQGKIITNCSLAKQMGWWNASIKIFVRHICYS